MSRASSSSGKNGGDEEEPVPTDSTPLIAAPSYLYAPLNEPQTQPQAQPRYHGNPNPILVGQAQSMHNLKHNYSFTPPSKSYSISADGSISYLTPLQMGRHELYEQLPFTAIFGLQKKERNLSRAFASYAADLDIKDCDSTGKMSFEEKETRRSRANLLLMDELEIDRDVVTTPLIFAVFVAALAQFLVGYNTGVMNSPSKVVFPGHTQLEWSLAVAAFAIGGPFGALLAGRMADSRGRRGAILIDTWTFLLGGTIQTCAWNMNGIIFSRLIIGFASGFASVLVPIYLGELAPPTLRGMLGTLTQFAMVIGILVSDLFAFPFSNERGWRVLFAVTIMVTITQLFCAPFLLESPRWLLNRDPNSRKARYIIKKLRGLRYDSEVETEVNHFISASRAQQASDEIKKNAPQPNKKGGLKHSKSIGQSSTFMEMWKDDKLRRLLTSCLVLQMAQQLCGINAVFYYSTMFFDGVIDNPLVGTTIVGVVNVVATYIALLLMDSCGRRTLILWSAAGMFFSCIVIILTLSGYLQSIAALIAVNVYVFFFEIGLGPIPWLIVAEMFDAKYVTTAMSASCQLNWVCNFIIGLIFPYMNQKLGAYSFLPFAVVLLGAFVFTLFILPETQGSNPEELQGQLVKKHSHTVFHNMNIENMYSGGANSIDLEWRLAMDQIRNQEEQAMKDGKYNYGFQSIDSPIPPPPPTAEANVTQDSSDWQSSMGMQ